MRAATRRAWRRSARSPKTSRAADLVLSPQSGERSYFARDRRPDALATLDFSRPAAELAALVRALDFGPYPNPLARPKVYLGDKVLWVRTARVADAASSAAPGTVVAAAGDELRVATADGDLLLSGLSDAGGPAAHGLAPGAVLPPLDAALRERLAGCATQAAKGESFWRRAFAALAPVEVPYPRMSPAVSPASRQVRVSLHVPNGGAKTVAAFFAWLSALTGQERVSALYCDAGLAQQAQGLESWLAAWVPLTLATSPDALAAHAAGEAEAVMAKAREAGPWPLDLPSRLEDRHPALPQVAPGRRVHGPR